MTDKHAAETPAQPADERGEEAWLDELMWCNGANQRAALRTVLRAYRANLLQQVPAQPADGALRQELQYLVNAVKGFANTRSTRERLLESVRRAERALAAQKESK